MSIASPLLQHPSSPALITNLFNSSASLVEHRVLKLLAISFILQAVFIAFSAIFRFSRNRLGRRQPERTTPYNDRCVICLEDLKTDAGFYKVLGECNHSYHKACIDRWLAIHADCPICRASAWDESSEGMIFNRLWNCINLDQIVVLRH